MGVFDKKKPAAKPADDTEVTGEELMQTRTNVRKEGQSLEDWKADANKRGNKVIHTGKFPIEVKK